jgi:hypothetical protein
MRHQTVIDRLHAPRTPHQRGRWRHVAWPHRAFTGLSHGISRIAPVRGRPHGAEITGIPIHAALLEQSMVQKEFLRTPIALGIMAIAATTGMTPQPAGADNNGRGRAGGTYLAGDFHNHSTCSDGSTSLQKKVKKSMDRNAETPWGLDWFVQAGHGGTGARNCTLVEDASLSTPAYPHVTGATPFDLPTAGNPSPSQFNGPQTTWAQSIGAAAIKGNLSGSGAAQNMHRWQSIQSHQYPLLEYLSALRNEPLFMGLESVVAGHEHTSMAVISGQMPASIHKTALPKTPGYNPLGNANALAMWAYCFDRGTSDTSRGNTVTQPGNVNTGVGNNWDCSVPGSANSSNTDWNAAAARLNGGSGNLGHAKTVEAVKWMASLHSSASYYVPAHLERAGPFNPAGNNGFNVEHLRNFNNAAPQVAFGFESQPGHGASDRRGEYTLRRNNFGSGAAPNRLDSTGGTTFGGTGVYAAQVGGVWDALLGEGRNWWFFASSDWHGRGAFAADDRRSDSDFWPGEYQRNYTMVRHGNKRVTPQSVVDGLRTGNNWVATGQLVDRLAFVACAVPPRVADHTGRFVEALGEAAVELLALNAAKHNTDFDSRGCVSMGEKLVVKPGSEVIVAVAVRDPEGKSYSPYSFPNPSLAQVGITQPLDEPELDRVDVIRGLVTGFKQPGASDYAGAWPDDWVDVANPQQLRPLTLVPAAAKNESAAVIKTFNQGSWKSARGDRGFKVMSMRLRDVRASQYLRLRGTNMPPSVPFETDAAGNPLSDLWTNTGEIAFKTQNGVEFPAFSMLRIPCKTVGTNVPDNATLYTGVNQPKIDGCPNHLPNVNGQRMVGFDIAAWSDLWFYSNPVFVEVSGSTAVAGVK